MKIITGLMFAYVLFICSLVYATDTPPVIVSLAYNNHGCIIVMSDGTTREVNAWDVGDKAFEAYRNSVKKGNPAPETPMKIAHQLRVLTYKSPIVKPETKTKK